MRRFRSLLIDRANLRVPGLEVQRVALHRHLPEHASVSSHRHEWCQAIVYLSGSGEQTIGASRARVAAGSLVLLPPGRSHAFARQSHRPPLCLLIDFRLKGARRHLPTVRNLNRSDLSQLRQSVAHLLRLQQGAGSLLRWEGAIPVLQLLLTILRAAGWIDRLAPPRDPAANPAVTRLLATVREEDPLTDVIQRSGYHRDHLNRVLKQHTGLTLGQYRAHQRLEKAKELLAQGLQVAHIGSAIGILDQSYFARWFRRQTGQTPSEWRRGQL